MTLRLPLIRALLLATSVMTLACNISNTGFAHPPSSPPDAPNASFNVIGHIEKFTLASPGDVFSKATITVRGIDVILPSNIQVVMPGQYLTPQQLFKGQTNWGDGTGNGRSGLALADKWVGPAANAPTTRIAFEAEIIGNIVGGEYRAGVIHISQGALHTGAGFIQSIDKDTGELRIGARLSNLPNQQPNGARVVLNDPEGIYGPPNTSTKKDFMKLDKRFALDSGNSPVHARTGFPVCVPDNAAPAKCPEGPNGNRPLLPANPTAADILKTMRFTCIAKKTNPADPPFPSAASNIYPHVGCNPKLPIPLRVGDYVTYLGMLTEGPEAKGATKKVFRIAAHALEVEMGVYTSPGQNPAYVFIEEALQGTLGQRYVDPTEPTANPPALIPSEETTRFRIVGFTSDPSRQIKVEIFDEGVTTDEEGKGNPPAHPGRSVTLSPEPDIGMPTTTGGQFGRFRGTWPSKDNARAVRREARVRVIGSLPKVVDPGWTTSEYVAPIAEYIYPEPTTYGNPGYMLPVPFESFCFLSQGKWVTDIDGTDVPMQALVPFPNSGHPVSQEIGRTLPAPAAPPPHVCGETEPP